MDIYSSRIMELATDIAHIGPIKPIENLPIGKSLKVSKICGSQISVELQINEELQTVQNFAIIPKACALGQASAAILSKNIIGASIKEVRAARDSLYNMLKNNGTPISGRFWEIRYLETVIDYLPRHASVLLAWDATLEAIANAIKQ